MRILVAILVIGGLWSITQACQSSQGSAQLSEPNLSGIQKVTSAEGITEYRLDNGLKVLLFPDPSNANLTVNITYFVGSRHEGYGEAGMAHLLEHMVFKGTPERPHIWQMLQDRGADFNGTTWTDRTNYYETLPASPDNLEFALALEADRMMNSLIAEQDLKKEFSVVRNEFEMQENNPAQILLQRMHSAAYLWHNYGKSTIGNRSDIEKVPISNLQRFYKKYYQPDNAMLVVSGNFESEQALKAIQKYFSPIPKPSRVLAQTHTKEPVQDGERSVIMRRQGDVAWAGVLYHIVPGSHQDFVPIEAYSHLMLHEPSGRLYEKLVKVGLATNMMGGPFAWKEPGTFWVLAQAARDTSPEKVQKQLIKLLEHTAPSSLTQKEVDRYRNQTLSQFRMKMADSQAIAIGLSEWAALGDWRLMFLYRDQVENLKVDQVRNIIPKYFLASNRTQGLFLPETKPLRAPEPVQPEVKQLLSGYLGKDPMAAGETFEASYENLAKRTTIKTLPNGAKLALLPKKTRGQTVELEFSIQYGTEESLKKLKYAEELLPALMLRGTKSLSYQDLRDRLVELDAVVTGSRVEPGLATFRVTTRREKLPDVMALMADILKQPRLAKDEFQILKKQAIADLQEGMKDPNYLAGLELTRLAYPFSKSSLFYVPSIEEKLRDYESLSLKSLHELYGQFWGMSYGSIAVIGDFNPEEFEKQVVEALTAWSSPKPFNRPTPTYQQSIAKDVAISTPGKAGAMVLVGHNIPLNVTDPRYPALKIGSFMLGGSPNSRLFERLRQKEGLVYGAWGQIIADEHGNYGRFLAGGICAPQNIEKVMQIVDEEIRRFQHDGVNEQELQQAKASLAATVQTQLADDRILVSLLGRSLRENRDIEFYNEIMKKIERLDASTVNQILRDTIKPEQLSKVRAGDLDKLRISRS